MTLLMVMFRKMMSAEIIFTLGGKARMAGAGLLFWKPYFFFVNWISHHPKLLHSCDGVDIGKAWVAGASRDEQVQVPELIKTGRLNCPKYLFLLPRGGGEL